jgi:hypothetical protein
MRLDFVTATDRLSQRCLLPRRSPARAPIIACITEQRRDPVRLVLLRGVARDWARAVWNARPDIDGLPWAFSTLPVLTSIVLFQRVSTALPAHPTINGSPDQVARSI